MIPRDKVFRIINNVREEQDAYWGGAEHDAQHEIGSWITYMRVYLRKAEESLAGKDYSDYEAMHNIQKVVALGVACMEYQYD
jgi:hypothetical protein